MKQLQKIKVLVNNGKKDSQESIGEPKYIADSVADELIQQAKEVDCKAVKGIKSIIVWEEVKAEKPKTKKETK